MISLLGVELDELVSDGANEDAITEENVDEEVEGVSDVEVVVVEKVGTEKLI